MTMVPPAGVATVRRRRQTLQQSKPSSAQAEESSAWFSPRRTARCSGGCRANPARSVDRCTATGGAVAELPELAYSTLCSVLGVGTGARPGPLGRVHHRQVIRDEYLASSPFESAC